MKILAALHAVLTAMSAEGIGKNRKNEQQHYKFRGIDDVYNAISGLFAANRILPLPRYADVVQTERESSKGGVIFVTRLNGYFKLKSLEDGSEIEIGPFPGEAMDSADKSTNKAMSASFKYALMQTFVIPTEGDNDADATTHEPAPRRRSSAEDDARHYGNDNRRKDSKAGAGPAPTGSKDPESAPANDSGPAGQGPLAKELGQLLDKYGKKRSAFAKKTAEAFGVATVNDIPEAKMPAAIIRVMTHQSEMAKRSADKKPAETPPADAGGVAGPIDDGEIPV